MSKAFHSPGGAIKQQNQQVDPHISPGKLAPDIDVPVRPPRTNVNAASKGKGRGNEWSFSVKLFAIAVTIVAK